MKLGRWPHSPHSGYWRTRCLRLLMVALSCGRCTHWMEAYIVQIAPPAAVTLLAQLVPSRATKRKENAASKLLMLPGLTGARLGEAWQALFVCERSQLQEARCSRWLPFFIDACKIAHDQMSAKGSCAEFLLVLSKSSKTHRSVFRRCKTSGDILASAAGKTPENGTGAFCKTAAAAVVQRS